MKIRDPKSIRRAATVAALAVRGLAHSYRFAYRPLTSYVVNDRPELLGGAKYIYAFWHEALLFPTVFRGRANILISQHADGELIARVCQHLGAGVVRGSTTRGGLTQGKPHAARHVQSGATAVLRLLQPEEVS